jgi:hypothetical protein
MKNVTALVTKFLLSKENVSDAQNEKQVRRRLYGAPFLFNRMNETLSGIVRHFN